MRWHKVYKPVAALQRFFLFYTSTSLLQELT